MHIRLIPHYIFWHYTLGTKDYFNVVKRFLRAIATIFSLGLMFKTFFQPFERLGEQYNGGVSSFFETFIVNTLMRLVGMVVRFCVIVIGSLAWFLAFVFCAASMLLWFVAPLIPVVFVGMAFHSLITAL